MFERGERDLREALCGQSQEANQQDRQEYAQAMSVLSLAGKHSWTPKYHREICNPLHRGYLLDRWGLAFKSGRTSPGIIRASHPEPPELWEGTHRSGSCGKQRKSCWLHPSLRSLSPSQKGEAGVPWNCAVARPAAVTD